MPNTTYRIEDLIKTGKNVDLTHYKTSLHDKIYDISYTVNNIMYDYIKELLDMSVEITLTEKEYNMYKYNPKRLAYKVYKSTDLYFIILILNDLTSYKDFDLTKVKIIHPKNIDILYEIMDSEKRYLSNSTVRMTSSSNKTYSVSSYGEKDDNILKLIEELQAQIDNIKGSIMDAIESVVGKDLDKILENIVNNEMTEIKNSIEQIINNNLTDVNNKITQLEQSIKNINILIETIVNGRLDERLAAIITRIDSIERSIPDRLKETLQKMRDDIDSLLPSLETIISERFKELLEKMGGDISSIGSNTTRDIGFSLLPPLHLGIQQDTEMLLPYNGTIINGTISTPIEDIKTSNIIVVLHIWDKGEKKWKESFKFNLHRDKYIDRFIMNIPIEDQPIRLSIESGSLNNVNGLLIVLSVLEKPGSNRKEGIIEPKKVIRNGMNVMQIPIDINSYKGMIDIAEKIQPSVDPAKYFLEVDGKIYSVVNNSLLVIDEFNESNFNKFGAIDIKDFSQNIKYISPMYSRKYEFDTGNIYITNIDMNSKGGV